MTPASNDANHPLDHTFAPKEPRPTAPARLSITRPLTNQPMVVTMTAAMAITTASMENASSIWPTGYPRQSCLEECGVNTYVCDIQQQKCVLSDKPGAIDESTCNANCGRGSVILCVYQCTGWIWQTCHLKDPSDPGLKCPNSQSQILSALEAPADSSCLHAGIMCQMYAGKPCGAGSNCDPSGAFCKPSGPPPPSPPALMCPFESAPAKYLGDSSDLNQQTCVQYDCSTGNTLCNSGGASQCPSVAIESNVCASPSLHSNSSGLRQRPSPLPSFLPSILKPKSSQRRSDEPSSLFASTNRTLHSAEWSGPVSNKHVSLKYDVEHSSDVLLVSQMTALVGIDCTQDGGMSLYLDAAQSSGFHVLRDALRSKPVLFGGREWQCVFPENDENGTEVRWTVKTIQRRVVEVSDVKLDGPHLVVQLSTEIAGLSQVFKNTKMSFKTSAFPPSTEMHDQSDSREHRHLKLTESHLRKLMQEAGDREQSCNQTIHRKTKSAGGRSVQLRGW